ncbi:MAG: DnaB-like helicase C-terminal domain-containing protein [Janthinobacterium lividum]
MSMSRPPSPRQQADAIRHAGRRACHAGLPETVNPYNQFLAARAWALWRQGWQFGDEERVDAAMEVIELCDDCAAAVESGNDPPARPGLLGIIKGRWSAHDLLLRDDEDGDVDDMSDDPDDGIDLPLSQEPCAGCGDPQPGPRWHALAVRRALTPSPLGPPPPSQGPVAIAAILSTMPALKQAGIMVQAFLQPVSGSPFDESLLAAATGDRTQGQLILLTGQPGTGRTSLALQIATAAASWDKTVAWFAHDRRADQVAAHLLAQAGLPTKSPMLSRPAAQATVQRLAALTLRIDDQPELAVEAVRQRCAELAAGIGLALVVIDYVQLMKLDRRAPSFEAALQLAKQNLRAMSRALDVPVLIIGSQRRRQPGKTQSPPGPDLQQLDPHSVCDRVLVLQRTGEAGQLLIVRPTEVAIPMRFDPVGLRFEPAAGRAS